MRHCRVSWWAVGDSWKHAVWWRTLVEKHLSLFLLFCPIFLLLESGRVCKSPSLCPRLYVCVLLCPVSSRSCAPTSKCASLFACKNVHGLPVPASHSMVAEKPLLIELACNIYDTVCVCVQTSAFQSSSPSESESELTINDNNWKYKHMKLVLTFKSWCFSPWPEWKAECSAVLIV